MSERFQYQPRTPEQIAKRATGNNFIGWAKDQFETFSPKKENQIRILPPTWQNPTHYGLDIWVHYSVGPERGTVLCLWKMQGKPCPICEAHARAEAAGRADANELKPTRRVVTWVIDRNREREKGEKKPLLWAMPATKVDAEIASICKDRETGQLYYIDDPDHGFDIFFNKEGEKIQTDYKGFQLARRESSVDQFYLDFITQNPIPNTLFWRTYEEVKAIFEGSPAQAIQQPTSSGTVVETVPPVAQPPAPFVAQWTGEHCGVCGNAQYTVESGGVTCAMAHPNAKSIEEIEYEKQQQAAAAAAPPPPAPVTTAPPPPPQPIVTAPTTPAPAIHHQPIVVNNPPPAQPAAPQPVAAAPASPAPPASSRVSGLRARFQTGN